MGGTHQRLSVLEGIMLEGIVLEEIVLEGIALEGIGREFKSHDIRPRRAGYSVRWEVPENSVLSHSNTFIIAIIAPSGRNG